MNEKRIGYVLNADTLGCTAGCRIDQTTNPGFGEMITIPAQDQRIIYGIIANVHILDDGLIRQLATTQIIDEHVIQDNRNNRVIPLEFSVIFLGFNQDQQIYYLLPPNPPLSLESVYACSDEKSIQFTSLGSGGYLRYLVADKTTLNFDLVAAHFRHLHQILPQQNWKPWMENATRTLIHLYRNDYDTLNALLHTLSDTSIFAD
ncbi:MAG TPA: hypothetical protein PLL88_01660 [Anaerolineaceae bacterium]|nr:hypothetical protein [Anaerolineaceae bacterium]